MATTRDISGWPKTYPITANMSHYSSDATWTTPDHSCAFDSVQQPYPLISPSAGAFEHHHPHHQHQNPCFAIMGNDVQISTKDPLFGVQGFGSFMDPHSIAAAAAAAGPPAIKSGSSFGHAYAPPSIETLSPVKQRPNMGGTGNNNSQTFSDDKEQDSEDNSNSNYIDLHTPGKHYSANIAPNPGQLRQLEPGRVRQEREARRRASRVRRRANSVKSLQMEQETMLVVQLKEAQVPWTEIVQQVNKRFGTRNTASCLQMRLSRWRHRSRTWSEDNVAFSFPTTNTTNISTPIPSTSHPVSSPPADLRSIGPLRTFTAPTGFHSYYTPGLLHQYQQLQAADYGHLPNDRYKNSATLSHAPSPGVSSNGTNSIPKGPAGKSSVMEESAEPTEIAHSATMERVPTSGSTSESLASGSVSPPTPTTSTMATVSTGTKKVWEELMPLQTPMPMPISETRASEAAKAAATTKTSMPAMPSLAASTSVVTSPQITAAATTTTTKPTRMSATSIPSSPWSLHESKIDPELLSDSKSKSRQVLNPTAPSNFFSSGAGLGLGPFTSTSQDFTMSPLPELQSQGMDELWIAPDYGSPAEYMVPNIFDLHPWSMPTASGARSGSSLEQQEL